MPHDHDRGLAFDLAVMARRRVLALTAAGLIAPQTALAAGCPALPQETAGPYPADGTNRAGGSLANSLTAPGVVRPDLRTSFAGYSGTAAGVPLALAVRVVDANAGCRPLAGHAVYLWQADRSGAYSIYDLPRQNYLRGVQLTDAAGQARFTTIFPGCYRGRFPHIHFQVYPSRAVATSGRAAILTSQFVLPRDVAQAVYVDEALYPESADWMSRLNASRDFVFGDNTPAQLAAMTPSISGSNKAGYRGAITVGVAR